MIQRLGNVLYWLGCVVAALLVAGGGVMAIVMARSTNVNDVSAAPYVGASLAAAAIVPWTFGRACKYIFTGQ
jgi:hypothetical protein